MSTTTNPPPQPQMRYTPPSVARGGVEAMAYRVLEVIAQAAMVIVTARLMEPAGRGLYALASLTAVLCTLPFGSVWSANAIEIAKQRTSLSELLGASEVIALVGGLLTAVVGFAVAAFMGDRWWVVAFPAATTPLILLARYGEGLFQSVGHIKAVNVITLGRVLLPLVIITPPLLAGASVRAAIEIWTLWLVVLPILIYIPLRGVTGRERLPRERGIYRRLVTTGMKLSVANTALMMSPRIALIVLAAFSGDVAVGVYSVAIAAGDVIYLFTYSVVSSAFRGISLRDRTGSIELTVRSLRHALLLALAIGVPIVPVVYVALPYVVGSGYEQVPGVLALLLPGILGLSGFWALHTFFTVQISRPAIVTRIALITLSANALLCLVLVPLAGLWGAALATSIANVLSAAFAFRTFRAISGVSLTSLYPGRAEVHDYVVLLRGLLGHARSSAS
jgi:O-antigen/teichoic acid export membrane protein